MPLLIDGQPLEEIPRDSKILFQKYPRLKETAAKLTKQETQTIGPHRLLYCCQKEYAVVSPHDKTITIVGSDDATTCMIVVLIHSESGVVGLGHFDGSDLEAGVEGMYKLVQELGNSLSPSSSDAMDLHLVGGFIEPKGYSEATYRNLLLSFNEQEGPINLVTACICEQNNIVRNGINHPIIYGIGVNIQTRQIFPAHCPDKGPDEPLRSCRSFAGHYKMFNIYDPHEEVIKIPVFNYKPYRGAEQWLAQPDEVIRQNLSTSPDVEPPHFVAHVRAALKFIYQNPFPSATVFPDSKPRCYKLDPEKGVWNRVIA